LFGSRGGDNTFCGRLWDGEGGWEIIFGLVRKEKKKKNREGNARLGAKGPWSPYFPAPPPHPGPKINSQECVSKTTTLSEKGGAKPSLRLAPQNK